MYLARERGMGKPKKESGGNEWSFCPWAANDGTPKDVGDETYQAGCRQTGSCVLLASVYVGGCLSSRLANPV